MKNKTIYILLSVSIFILTCNYTLAQYNDASLWTSVEIEKSLNKKFDLKTELAYRFFDNIQRTDKFFGEIGVKYKFNKLLRLSFDYRVIQKNIPEDGFYATRHRITPGLRLDYRFLRFGITYTGKYQLKFYDDRENNWGNTKITSYNRNKFQFKYRPKPVNLDPYIFYEMFIPLNSMNIYQYSIDTHRIGGGLDYQLNKKNSIKLFFLYERELHETFMINNHVIGIGYALEL